MQPQCQVEIWIQSNLSLRTPLYYGQFVWSHKYQKSYIPYLYNTDTPVKRTIGSVLLVSVLKRFDCIAIAKCLYSYRDDLTENLGQPAA